MANPNWKTTIELPRSPHCPVCGEPLHPSDFHTFRGVAFCRECQSNPNGARLATINSILESPNHSLLTKRRGLTFYTPTLGYPPRPADPERPVPPYAEHPREVQARSSRARTR